MRVLVPAVLRRYSNGEAECSIGAAESVRGALERLFARWPDLRPRVLDEEDRLWSYLLLFRNDERVGLDDGLAPDDTLEIVGAAEGG
ncbi:MAG: MoaD/ThiS family protein [Planctomycetota bacterium]|nr:MoaD/ThiS family protein [Planctomycetota bacterium]